MRLNAIILALVCGTALASPGDDTCVGNCDNGNGNSGNPGNGASGSSSATSSSTSTSGATSGAVSGSVAVSGGGHGGMGIGVGRGGTAHGGSAAGGSASVENVSGGDSSVTGVTSSATVGDLAPSAAVGDVKASVVFNTPEKQTIEHKGTTRVENTPDAPAIIASPTAVCRVTYGIGGSGPGIGLSFGSSVLDEGCDAREDARLLHNLGLHAEAVLRLCSKPEMAKALGARCPVPEPVAAKPEGMMP